MRQARPLICLTASFAAGIFAGAFLKNFWPALWGASAGLLLSFFLSRREKVFFLSMLAVFFAIGMLWIQLAQMRPTSHYGNFFKGKSKEVRLLGVISSDVRRSHHPHPKTTFQLQVVGWFDQDQRHWIPASGKIGVQIFRQIPFSYGDKIVLEGKLHPPFEFSSRGKFSYRKFLKRQGIEHLLTVKTYGVVDRFGNCPPSLIKKIALAVHHRFQKILESHLSARELGIMEGLLLGNRQHFDPHLQELFVLSGTAHVLAISGLHVVVVAFLFMVFCRMLPLPQPAQTCAAIFLLMFYSAVTGDQPSVVRSVIMTSIFLLSFCVERETDGLNTLSLAALAILLFDPLTLWDVGFQLSFVSVFAIILYSQMERRMMESQGFFERHPWTRSAINSFGISLAASLATAGIIAHDFHLITPVGLMANMVIVPLSTAAIVLGMGILFLGLGSPLLASLFAWSLKIVINLMAGAAAFFIALPKAYFVLDRVGLTEVLFYYLALVIIILGGFLITKPLRNARVMIK